MRRLIWLTLISCAVASADTSAQTLERIRDSGTFRIGYRADAAPYAHKDSFGEAVGYSVELCRAVAAHVKETLGLAEIDVEYLTVTTEDRFQALQDGRIDLLCGATTVTLARRELVDFSLFTFIDGAGVLLRKDGPQDFEGLAGMKVGVRSATTTEQALSNTLAQQGLEVEVIPVESHEDGLAQLRAGDIEAYFADRAILIWLLLQSGDEDLWLSERQFTYEPYALALARGDDDFRLLVDAALSRLYRSGAINQSFTSAFGTNANQSDMLKALYVINAIPR
jgi:polar amino acid transport system substrate-binding protein/glutamate/aspartate transport system substrate-binding protein